MHSVNKKFNNYYKILDNLLNLSNIDIDTFSIISIQINLYYILVLFPYICHE